jgi:uncharacterized membrane protein (DUF2068 family)
VRVVPKRWNNEMWVCSVRGHVAPAATVAHLRPGQDDALGLDRPDGSRLARCLRCDVWVAVVPPEQPTSATLPPADQLPRPRRQKALEDAILLRLIAVTRALHCVVFTTLTVLFVTLDLKLPGVQSGARSLADRLQDAVTETGRQPSRDWLVRELERVGDLRTQTLKILAVTAAAYAVVEGTEAVGLWLGKRWAEYLTVLATAGFLPFELNELHHKITVLRVTALTVNLAIVAWLIWNKRLFGLRGGAEAAEAGTDWDHLLHEAPLAHPTGTVTP